MAQLDDERLDEIREIFDHFDGDKNGIIDYDEFVRIIDALSGNMTNEDMKIGFGEIDSDHNGNIDFDEFIDWWAEQ